MKKTIQGRCTLSFYECDYCRRRGNQEGNSSPLQVEFESTPLQLDYEYAGITIRKVGNKDVCLECYENVLKLGLETYQP